MCKVFENHPDMKTAITIGRNVSIEFGTSWVINSEGHFWVVASQNLFPLQEGEEYIAQFENGEEI